MRQAGVDSRDEPASILLDAQQNQKFLNLTVQTARISKETRKQGGQELFAANERSVAEPRPKWTVHGG